KIVGDTVTYSATGLPSGLSINGTTGVISGTIGSDADTGGPFSVNVIAMDTVTSVTASKEFTWSVYSVSSEPDVAQLRRNRLQQLDNLFTPQELIRDEMNRVGRLLNAS